MRFKRVGDLSDWLLANRARRGGRKVRAALSECEGPTPKSTNRDQLTGRESKGQIEAGVTSVN